MNEQQLQDLLSVYRHRQAMPALSVQARAAVFRWWLAAVAAAAVIAMVAIWPENAAKWRIDGRALRDGETIAAPSRLQSRRVGTVDVGTNTVVRFEGGNRLTLQRGTIHAKKFSPPGIFVVDTPRARAIDLGCEYVLTISAEGGGLLHVTAGWVSLNNRAQSLVPAGAIATIAANGRLGPPVFDDASAEFKSAIAIGNLSLALSLARRRDSLTLINLFRNAGPQERTEIFNRLNALVPAPAGVTPDSIEPWWPAVIRASGVTAFKKKYPPRGNAQNQTNFQGW